MSPQEVPPLHVIVCIKSVPDTTQVRFDPETNTLLRGEVASIINPFDMYAIEEALRLAEEHHAGRARHVLVLAEHPAEQRLEDRKRRRARGNPVEEIDLDNLGASQDRPLLACFRGMPAAAYRDLAEDPSPITRMAVALNPDAPAEVRQALAHDPSLLVRAAASGAGARGEAA